MPFRHATGYRTSTLTSPSTLHGCSAASARPASLTTTRVHRSGTVCRTLQCAGVAALTDCCATSIEPNQRGTICLGCLVCW